MRKNVGDLAFYLGLLTILVGFTGSPDYTAFAGILSIVLVAAAWGMEHNLG